MFRRDMPDCVAEISGPQAVAVISILTDCAIKRKQGRKGWSLSFRMQRKQGAKSGFLTYMRKVAPKMLKFLIKLR